MDTKPKSKIILKLYSALLRNLLDNILIEKEMSKRHYLKGYMIERFTIYLNQRIKESSGKLT